MPLYEYYCRTCGQKFELLRPISRMDATAFCPAGHEGGERVMSVFAAVSKGGDGGVTALGSGCAGCSGGACASCGR